MKKIKVLLIEDNPGDARLILEALADEKEGSFEFEQADRISSAVKRLSEGGIDVILSDLSLPDSQGLETLFRERAAAPDVPIVVLTGIYLENLGVEAVQSGAQDYLLKERLDGRTLSHSLRYAIERKRTEEKLKKIAMELARSRAELEQSELFAFVATHDLQEPLHKLLTFSDLLQAHASAKLDDKEKEYINRIQHSAGRMREIIDRAREFSRIAEDGRPSDPVDLGNVIREAVADLDLRIAEARATLEIQGKFPAVNGDKTQLRQLFQNLIVNALKFCKEDEIPRITVRMLESDPGSVRIGVEDNGIGFEEQYLDQIFKPFKRLYPASRYPGSGMGLAICHKIVLRHGGTLTAKSTLGRGSVFMVVLPTIQGVTDAGK